MVSPLIQILRVAVAEVVATAMAMAMARVHLSPVMRLVQELNLPSLSGLAAALAARVASAPVLAVVPASCRTGFFSG